MNKLSGLRSNRSKLMYVLIALQLAFLSGLALSYYAVDWIGKEIRLKTAPVDPRDLFYGDYVILSYEISSLPRSLWKGNTEAEIGESVYVALKPKGDVYTAIAVYPEKPDVSSDVVVLIGKVGYSWDDTIRLTYGLERYYVPEGTGKQLEEVRSDMIVTVKVAPWGQMRISDLEY